MSLNSLHFEVSPANVFSKQIYFHGRFSHMCFIFFICKQERQYFLIKCYHGNFYVEANTFNVIMSE